MSVALEGLGLVVAGQAVLHPVTLDLPPGLPNVLLGPTVAGKTSLMRLMAGLDRPSEGRLLADGRDVTGSTCASAASPWSTSSSSTTRPSRVYENIASPLRVARLPRGRDRARGCARPRALLQLTPCSTRKPLELSGGQQQRTRHRPRAGQAAPTWCCSTSRWPISTTSCARSCARNCRASSPSAGASSSMRRPSRPRRCCSAAAPRRCGRAGSPSSARRREVYPPARTTRHRAGLLRPAAELMRRRAARAARLVARRPARTPAGGRSRRCRTGAYTVGFRAHQLSLEPRPGAVALPATVRVTEITARRASCTSMSAAVRLGGAGAGRATARSRARRSRV